MSRHTLHRGYTLVELMVTLVIMGIAGALLVPALGDFGAIETQAAVRRLVSDIAFAQSDAVARQGYRRLHFFDDGTGWCLVQVDDGAFFDAFNASTADFVADPASVNRGGGDFIVNFAQDDRFESVHIESVTTAEGGSDLTFDALGGTVAAPGTAAGAVTVVLAGDGSRWEVDVAPVTGRTSVQKLN